jgi:hypothetical protein
LGKIFALNFPTVRQVEISRYKKTECVRFSTFSWKLQIYSKKRSLCRKRLGSELWELRVGGSAASRDQEKAQLLTDTDSTRHPDITSRPQQMLSFRQVQLSKAIFFKG